MGKVKKKKFSAPKPRPTGLPSVAECEADLELPCEPASSSLLNGIIERLQSPNEETRECACTTVAGIVAEPGAIASLLKLNIIKILSPLVLDHSWDVRHRAVGALRNLSVDGGVEACEEMIKYDVLTPLMALIHQFGTGDQFAEGQKQKRKVMICEAYAHAFHILLNLCENSGVAVTTFNRENLLPVICHILSSGQFTEDLVLATVQCLHTVTEDNTETCRPELVKCVQSLMTGAAASPQQTLIKILATGVLVNLEGSRFSSARGDLVVPVVATVAEVLGVNLAVMLMALHNNNKQGHQGDEASNMEASGGGSPATEENDSNKVEEGTDARVTEVLNVLQAQKVALEITTNLCCAEDEDWEDLSSSESSCDDVSADQEVNSTEEEMCTDNGVMTPLCVPTELHTAFVNSAIVPKVLEAAQSLTPEQESVLQNIPGGIKVKKGFVGKQTHALLCINNLVSCLEAEALGGADRLYGVWQGLLQLATSQSCMKDQSLLESVTSAMRAVIQKLAELDPAKGAQASDLQFMYEMATKCEWSEVRVNALRVVSTIGSILAQNKTPHLLLKDVGVFLLEVVCKDSDLWVVAESLDAIFDVFGEDHVDPVVREIGLVEKLKTVAPQLKSKIHANKKSLGEHYPVISTARTNLVRFIKYKMTK